ncbi:hypothetical protein DYB30_005994 [Aphanomyces astaci]|uniref:t-SNARE coiled-coil homology domain-containing protein n=2 Tax=Aphanomyces astaci TaxID=112090 RepID=A0A397D8R9_APHAT|nr:hypothetical protein DYB30_005994 [Aphanomyces astaci]
MFNDPTSQINELTQLVKQDITLIHTKLDDLEVLDPAVRLHVTTVPLAFSAPLPRPVGVEGEGGGSEHVPLISAQQFVVPEQGYADSRAEAVSNIQSHIVELGELFQRLSVMISAQGDSVRIIDENVDDAVVNVHQGTRQLEMFRDSLSNSALMMKVGGILVVFVVLFLFFMA